MAATQVRNDAQIQPGSGQTDTNPGNNTTFVLANVYAATIAKTASPISGTAVPVGQVITYTLTATVTGAATTQPISFTDTLSAGLVLVPGSLPAACSAVGQVVTCALPAGSAVGAHTFSYQATVAPTASGSVSNSVTGADGCTAAASCTTTHPVMAPAVTYSKAADTAGPVAVGDTITYTLTTVVANSQTTSVTTLTDTLGTGLTFGSVSNAGAYTCNAASPLVCTLPAGTAPGTYTVTYTATVNAQAVGTVDNAVVGSNADCTTNCGTSTPVDAPAVTYSKAADTAGPVAVGDTITYTLTTVVANSQTTSVTTRMSTSPCSARQASSLQACDAVSHAHARRILHQDVKPSNMLVSGNGHLKLLDFGLSTPLADIERRKRIAITSGYTAPEVLRGESAGVGVDIYSLGVTLCHLLCGRHPDASTGMSNRPGERPSVLARRMTAEMLAARGATSIDAMRRQLSGELDSIVMHCIDGDPAARYASVDQLQADLRRWLSGHPVAAHGNGLLYRSRRMVGRHAALFAAGALALFALAGAGGLWAWQRAQAERDRISASQVDRLFESSMGMATLSGLGDMPLTPVRMLQSSETFLRSESTRGQADVRARGLSVLARSWATLGDYAKAEALAREAGEGDTRDVLFRAFNAATLAQIRNQRANYGDAEATAREGLSLLPIRLSDQYRLARVRLMAQLAAAQTGKGESRQAFATLASAIDEANALPADIGNPVVAQLLVQRGTWYRWRFRLVESEADLQRAIALAGKTEPVIADDARESLMRTVRASRMPGREARSLALANELLASRRRTLGERHPQTGIAWTELAYVRMLNADDAGAREAIVQARGILRDTVGVDHPAYARMEIAQAFADSLAGRIDDAMREAESGLATYRKRLGDTHEATLDARFLLSSLHWSKCTRSGDPRECDRALDMIRAAIDDSVRTHGDVAAIHRMALATLLAARGDRAAADQALDLARDAAIRQYGKDSQEALHLRFTELSTDVDRDGDAGAIARSFRALQSDLRKVDTLYARSIAHSTWLLEAQWQEKHGDTAAARAALMKAKHEATAAGQPAWVQVADGRLKQLDAAANAVHRH